MRIDDALEKTFTFDATNMLTRVNDVSKGEASYSYNGMNKRVSVVNPTEKIEYLLDLTKDYHNILERSVNGEVETYTYDSNVISMSKEGQDYFYMNDELGTGMYLTGTDGMMADFYAYDEFGRTLDPITGKRKKADYTEQGKVIQAFAFTGYQYDEIIDGYYAQARYYDGNIGRFISRDKDRFSTIIDAETFNVYEYCQNRPIDYVDYTGNDYEAASRGTNAHTILEHHAQKTIGPNVQINYRINGGAYHSKGEYGLADIVVFNGPVAEIYEIKPASYLNNKKVVNNPYYYKYQILPDDMDKRKTKFQLGIEQKDGYVNAYNFYESNNAKYNGIAVNRAISGTNYNSFFNVRLDSGIEGYDIEYFTKAYAPGMIYYKYVPTDDDDDDGNKGTISKKNNKSKENNNNVVPFKKSKQDSNIAAIVATVLVVVALAAVIILGGEALVAFAASMASAVPYLATIAFVMFVYNKIFKSDGCTAS